MGRVENGVASFGAGYMDRAINDVSGIISDMRERLKDVKYDTIVATGSSGALIAPIVARALRKKYLIVRKPEEYESSHSGAKYLGNLGGRWLFLDDFCSSGRTFRRVRDAMVALVAELNEPRYTYYDPETGQRSKEPINVSGPKFKTELVGYYEYEHRNGGGYFAWNEEAQPGYSDMYCTDTPKGIKEAREHEEVRRREQVENLYNAKVEFARQATPPPPPFPEVGVIEPDKLGAPVVTGCFMGMPGCDCKALASQPITIDQAVKPDESFEIRTWGDLRAKNVLVQPDGSGGVKVTRL